MAESTRDELNEAAAETSATEAATERAVLAANASFYAAFNEKDAEAMEAIWARTTPVACIHPGWNALEEREAVIESWRRILSNPDQPKIVSGAESALVRGETAIVVGRELVSGSPIATTNGFVLEAGKWKIFLHHASPVAGVG